MVTGGDRRQGFAESLKDTMKFALFLLTIPAFCQVIPQVHVSANLLSSQTTASMFGRLPKPYSAAAVSVCNETAAPVTMALAAVAQKVAVTGYVMLPKDAALSVIAAAQGSSLGSKVLRGSIAAVQIAAIAAGWSTLSAVVKNTLTSAALAGASVVSVLGTAIPSHVYLTFDHEALPDPLVIAANGCASGVVIVEVSKTPGLSVAVPMPDGGK
jgi:hypothetical protein